MTATVTILLSDLREILDTELNQGVWQPELIARHRRMTATLVRTDNEILKAANDAIEAADAEARRVEDHRQAAAQTAAELKDWNQTARREAQKRREENPSTVLDDRYETWGEYKIKVIKLVRAEFGTGLKEAKSWTERTDCPPISRSFAQTLIDAGARVQLSTGEYSINNWPAKY